MTLTDWLRKTTQRLRADGLDGLHESIRDLRCGYLRRRPSSWDGGENVYDRDWDMLVVLDACRYDLFESVSSEYEYDELDSFHSPGSCSGEWMRETFTDDYRAELRETVYVNGNPNGPANLPTESFLRFDDVWRYAWDEELNTVHPDPLTDRAVALAREHDPDRLVVHYMQPHHPFVSDPIDDDEGVGVDGETTTVWELLARGDLSRAEVWRRYADNLRFVLDRLDTLLENVDAPRTVFTADHGNLLGEYGITGHPVGVTVPELRRVPWVETTAHDERTYTPTLEPPEDEPTDADTQQRLAALGYVDG